MGIRKVGSSVRVFFVVLLILMGNSMATAQPNPGSERVAAVMVPLSFMPTGCRDVANSGNCSFGRRLCRISTSCSRTRRTPA